MQEQGKRPSQVQEPRFHFTSTVSVRLASAGPLLFSCMMLFVINLQPLIL